MSDEQQVITKVEKEKDPRRVASGKRLASISIAAKENARRKRSEACDQGSASEESDPSSGGYSVATVIAGVGVLAGLACLYLAYKQDARAQSTNKLDPESEKSEANTSLPVNVEQRRTGKQYSLDD